MPIKHECHGFRGIRGRSYHPVSTRGFEVLTGVNALRAWLLVQALQRV